MLQSQITNAQLYLLIGVPIAVNFAIGLTFYVLLNGNISRNLDAFRAEFNARFDSVNQRFDDMRDLWRAELHRVEEVIVARLRHLESR